MRQAFPLHGKGAGDVLKILFVVALSGLVLVSGAVNCARRVRVTNALDEIVRFINFVKAELHYRAAEYDSLLSRASLQNYKYLSFLNGQIYLCKDVDEPLRTEFNGFLARIGTTDDVGQLSLCDEYKQRFEQLLTKRRAEEKSKLQVNTALSVFGAMAVLIFFL